MRIPLTLTLLALMAQTPAPVPTSPQGQQPPLTFKVEVNYVEIDATVTDAQGNFVRNLTRDDFQLVEDGKPQTVSAFSMVDITIERADPLLYAKAVVPPDVASNRTPFEGRVFILVLDDLQTKFSQTSRARAAARQFVERYIGANDMVAIVNTSGYGKAMQDFTSNHQLLLKAIDASMGNKADSATSAALKDYFMNRDTPGAASNVNANMNELERFTNARNSLRTLKSLADYLAGMRGRRKAVVYFSEGINYDIVNPMANAHATDVQRELHDLVAAATRANVNIYSVDPRGVVSGMEDAIEIGSFADDNSIKPSDLLNELRIEQDSLRALADETGGLAVLNQNDFRTGFSRILTDNSTYYVLGYYPTNEKQDGRFRTVQVRVLRPGLTVRARKGYVAPTPAKKAAPEKGTPAERTSPELRDALDSPIPVSGLTLNAFAAPFKGAGANDAIAMAIEIDGRSLQFTPTQGVFDDSVEISLFASDTNGKIKDGAHDIIALKLKPATYDVVRQSAVRVMRTIQVPPGKYQLRIGARETGAGRVGSVIYDLDAPDFSKGPLTMSGVAISSASGSRIPTVRAAAPPPPPGGKGKNAAPSPASYDFKDVLPAPPSALRDFRQGDSLAVFAEIYDNVTSAPHKVDITASVLADDGKVVFTKSDTRGTEELHGSGGGYGYTTTIPLAGLARGRYVLRVEAKSRLGNSQPIAREVEFRIE